VLSEYGRSGCEGAKKRQDHQSDEKGLLSMGGNVNALFHLQKYCKVEKEKISTSFAACQLVDDDELTSTPCEW
jgi:hypothetical protein